VQDRSGNLIYLTDERWQHIIAPDNHPELAAYEDHLREALRRARRKQDRLNPQKYRYTLPFDDLVEENTHVEAVVLFRFRDEQDQRPVPNNYVVTAYLIARLSQPTL
jgi:hypothetical protein